MKIAQLAPLWESVPPKTYGGTELVVYSLCEQFHKKGHDVTLFACGDSRTSVELDACIERSMREMGVQIPTYYEMESIANLITRADEFDIIHNHMGFQFLPFMRLIKTPVVTTLHGAFVNDEETSIYRNYKDACYISISDSQRRGAPYLNYVSTVYNGIDIERYPFQETPNLDKPYLVFLGRLSQEKGAHLAIELAKQTDFTLIMAGKIGFADVEYYESQVKHLIDGKKIVYIGEVGHKDKCELLKGAYATLHTVTWPEPFGLVMAESMLCGTPVLALRDGSIPEVIKDGVTGFIADDIDTLLTRVDDVEKIDRKICRQHVQDNFSSERMAENYLRAYEKVINQHNLMLLNKMETAISSNILEN